MLTFEEFFTKKRIDLPKLQLAEPDLFAEFSKHYPLMGEKSFDHAKKYWFNQLRRTYPLPEIAKPHPVLAEAISNLSVQSIAVAAAQNLDADIEKPKFKEDELVGLSDKNIPEKDISLAGAEQEILQSQSEVPKPVFKPRFNPKNIPKSDRQQIENEVLPEIEIQKTEAPKPAFKPRFSMQNIKKDVVKTVSDSVESTASPENLDTKPEDTSNETAFLPDFNPENTPQKTIETFQETETNNNEPKKPEAGETKQPYKPRFQMKNINKPAQPD